MTIELVESRLGTSPFDDDVRAIGLELKAAREVVSAARELIRNNDSLDRESVLMKDVDAIRSVLETLDEATKSSDS